MTIILSIAIMIAVVAALSIKVLLGREREVKRFGCGSFSPAGPAGPGAASTSCGVCGAEEGEGVQERGRFPGGPFRRSRRLLAQLSPGGRRRTGRPTERHRR